MPKTETLIAQDPDRRIDENEPERQPAAQRGVDRIRRPSVLLIVLGVAIIPVQPGRQSRPIHRRNGGELGESGATS